VTELQNIIAQGEGYFTEFKRNINSDLKKELVAFANASGGNIFLGIEDDGTVCGIQITNHLISQIQDATSECDPPVNIEIINHSNQVLQIHVFESNTKPHRTTTGFYLRVGANSQTMRTDNILEFLEKEGRVRFDERVRNDIDFNRYFSENQWRRFLVRSGISPDVEKLTILQSLGAIKMNNGNPVFTTAGVLVFTDSPTLFLQQAYVTCVAFRTPEKVDIVDRKDFTGDFFTNIEIYPDKIIISNPGGLPKGMPEADFGKYSLARNATLANLMQRAGFIEKLGTGITRIRQEAEKAGIHDVEFSFGYFFAVEFKRVADSWKSSEKSSEKILNLISTNKNITIKELANELNITRRTVEKNLAKLKVKGMLQRVGSDKGGFWVVNNTTFEGLNK